MRHQLHHTLSTDSLDAAIYGTCSERKRGTGRVGLASVGPAAQPAAGSVVDLATWDPVHLKLETASRYPYTYHANHPSQPISPTSPTCPATPQLPTPPTRSPPTPPARTFSLSSASTASSAKPSRVPAVPIPYPPTSSWSLASSLSSSSSSSSSFQSNSVTSSACAKNASYSSVSSTVFSQSFEQLHSARSADIDDIDEKPFEELEQSLTFGMGGDGSWERDVADDINITSNFTSNFTSNITSIDHDGRHNQHYHDLGVPQQPTLQSPTPQPKHTALPHSSTSAPKKRFWPLRSRSRLDSHRHANSLETTATNSSASSAASSASSTPTVGRMTPPSSTHHPALTMTLTNQQRYYDIGSRITGVLSGHCLFQDPSVAVLLVLTEQVSEPSSSSKPGKKAVSRVAVLASCRRTSTQPSNEFHFDLEVPETYPQHHQLPLSLQRRLPPSFINTKKGQSPALSFPQTSIAYTLLGIVSPKPFPPDSYLAHLLQSSDSSQIDSPFIQTSLPVTVLPSYSPVDRDMLDQELKLRNNGIEGFAALDSKTASKKVYKASTTATEGGLLRNSIKSGVVEVHIMGLQYYSMHDQEAHSSSQSPVSVSPSYSSIPSTSSSSSSSSSSCSATNEGKSIRLNFLFFPDPGNRKATIPSIASVAMIIHCRQVVSLSGDPFTSYPVPNSSSSSTNVSSASSISSSHHSSSSNSNSNSRIHEHQQEAIVYEKNLWNSNWTRMPAPAHLSKSVKLYFNHVDVPFTGLRDLQNSAKYQSGAYNLQIAPTYVSAYSCRDYEAEIVVKLDPPKTLRISVPLAVLAGVAPQSSFPWVMHPDENNL